jgi:AraC-like DNA-binding protein
MQVKTQKVALFDGIELKSAHFKGLEFPPHFHEGFAITVLEQGCERVGWQGREAVQYARTVSIINPDSVHSNRFFDDDAWHYRSCYLNPDAMHHLLGGVAAWFPNQILEDGRFAAALLRFHHSGCEARLLDLVPFFRQYHMKKPDAETPAPPFLEAATDYLRRHLGEKIALEDVARHCGTDKFKLLRAFKKAQGITPISYLILCRVEYAKRLVRSDLPLTRVALESGFYDQSHFIHCFKKYVGVSPDTYKSGLQLTDC